MERIEQVCSGVQELVSSTNLSLPVGAVTYPGNFEERAEAYVVAKALGIEVGTAHGLFTYMFSDDDCKLVREYILKKRVDSYRADY